MANLTAALTLNVESDLEWYNASSLRTMLRSRGDRGRDARSKSEVISLLRQCLFDPSSIQSALASANPISREALALLKKKGGAMPVAAMIGQVAVWHPELKASQIRAVPSELVRRALAFWHTPTSRYGRPNVHDVQRPATENVHSAMIFSAPSILQLVDVPPSLGDAYLTPVGPADVSVPPVEWQRQMLAFLRAIETRAPRILQSGVIGSRDREALAQAVGLCPDVPGAPRLSPVSFYRTVLDKAGLLEITGDRQLRTTAASLAFVSLSPTRQVQTLLNAWIEAGENELLTLAHLHCERHANVPKVAPDPEQLRRAHRLLVDLLREKVRPGQWYDLDDVSRVIRHQDVEFLVTWLDPAPYRWSSYEYYSDRDRLRYPPYPGVSLEDARGRSRGLVMGEDWDLVEGAFIRVVFHGPLTWLGLVQCRRTSDGRDTFAITPLGAQALELEGSAPIPKPDEIASNADALIVQPNFEVVVYAPEERTELLFHIDRFAERVSFDRLAIYRLTNESLCSGLQLGLRVDDVIGLLEGAARTPIPQNVLFSLRDWARRFDEVHWVRNAWLIEAPDAATLDRWLEQPEIEQAVDRRISPTVALCVGARPANLVGLLARAGADVTTIDANAPLQPCGRAEGFTKVWIPASHAHHYLRGALEEVADVANVDDRGYTFQISPRSVERAMSAGKTTAQILDLLEQIVQGPIPGGMRVRIKGWAGDYAAVALGEVGIFAAPDAEAFRDLRSDPVLSTRFIQTISPTAAIVDLDALDELRAALAERGIEATTYQSPRPMPVESAPPPVPNGFAVDDDLAPVKPGECRSVIERAMLRGHALTIQYRQEQGTKVRRLVVRPREMFARNGSYYVAAYCEDFQGDRDFKIANILAIGLRPDRR